MGKAEAARRALQTQMGELYNQNGQEKEKARRLRRGDDAVSRAKSGTSKGGERRKRPVAPARTKEIHHPKRGRRKKRNQNRIAGKELNLLKKQLDIPRA